LASAGLSGCDLAAIGIANQRETTVAWDAVTGEPLYNALVWQDTRTQAIIDSLSADQVSLLRKRTGLGASTYFSGSKMKVPPPSWSLNRRPPPMFSKISFAVAAAAAQRRFGAA
jgi:glycerol kinase